MERLNSSTRIHLLRILAAVGVVVIHMMGTSRAVEISLDSLARFSVPVFVLISGYCVLPKADSAAYVLKKSLRLLCLMLSGAFCYYLYFYVTRQTTFDGILSVVKYLLTEPLHFWYFYMAAGLYLFAPALKILLDHTEKRLLSVYILLFFVLGSPVTMLVRSGLSPTFNLLVEKTKLAYTLGFPCLFLLGGYIRKYGVEKKCRYILYLLGVLSEIAVILFNLRALRQNAYTDFWNSFYAPNAMLMGVSVFLLVFYLPADGFFDNPRVQKLLRYLSSLTLGIYILHPMVINALYLIPAFPPSLFLRFIAVVGASALIAALWKLLPVIGKWI